MSQKPYFTRVAMQIQDEVGRTAKAIAKQMPFAEDSPDAKKMTEQDVLRHIKENADTPGFLEKVLERMAPKDPSGMRPLNGLKYFLTMIEDARPDLYYQGTGLAPKTLEGYGPVDVNASFYDMAPEDVAKFGQYPGSLSEEPMMGDPYQEPEAPPEAEEAQAAPMEW